MIGHPPLFASVAAAVAISLALSSREQELLNGLHADCIENSVSVRPNSSS